MLHHKLFCHSAGGRAVRIGLRNRVSPGTRDAVFGAAVLTALAHAGYVSIPTLAPSVLAPYPALGSVVPGMHVL